MSDGNKDSIENLMAQAVEQYNKKNYAESEILFKKILEITTTALGRNHNNTLQIMETLGGIYNYKLKRCDDAERLYSELLTLRIEILGEEHDDTIKIMDDLACLYRYDLNRYDDAEILYKKILTIRSKKLGEEHQDTLDTMDFLGMLFMRQNRYLEAESLFKKILEIQEKNSREEQKSTASTMDNLARLYIIQKRYEEAKALLIKIIEINKKTLGDNHKDTIASIKSLKDTILKQERSIKSPLMPGEQILPNQLFDEIKNIPFSTAAIPGQRSYVDYIREELIADNKTNDIRIFISSTFKDMMEERQYLIKYVFPEIAKRCRERNVNFTVVDLLWGITEEAAQQGKVIEICLKEIDRCRPYFIGILGDRYGWIPGTSEYKKHKRLIENYPWVKDDIDNGLSVTEIEFQYGALRNASTNAKVFFYLKNLNSVKKKGSSSERKNSQPGEKLIKLKDFLQNQEKFPVRAYNDIEVLGRQVSDDLWKMIESDFPLISDSNELMQSHLEHVAFLKSRLNIYIRGEDYITRLNQHVEGDSAPLVITGAPGSGKSALIANWIYEYQKEHPDIFILFYFTGCTPGSTDPNKLLKRILEELKDRFEIPDKIDDKPLRSSLATLSSFLSRTGKFGKWILVIDAVDRIDQNYFAPLSWFPEQVPSFVRVILASSPGKTLDILKRGEFQFIEVEIMNKVNKMKFIEDYLEIYGKSLKKEMTDKIAISDIFDRPMIIRTLLDELLRVGEHNKIGKQIDYYLERQGTAGFFNAFLEQMESDYEIKVKGMVGKILSLIWIAHKGLSEQDLLSIANAPQLYWLPLYNALENQLINKNGLLYFVNEDLEDAVEKRYLDTSDKKLEAHNKLADYFFNQEPDHVQTFDQLPYHLQQISDWNRLKNYLGRIEVIQAFRKERSVDLINYWKDLANYFDMGEVYLESMEEYSKKDDVTPLQIAYACEKVGDFLMINQYLNTQLHFYEKAAKIKKEVLGEFHPKTAEALANLGKSYSSLNRNKEAESLLLEAIEKYKKIKDGKSSTLAFMQDNLAQIYYETGRIKKAEALRKKSMEIVNDEFGIDNPVSAMALIKQIVFSEKLKNLKKVASKAERALEILRKALGDRHYGVAFALIAMGIIRIDQRRFEEGEKLIKRALKTMEEYFGIGSPISSIIIIQIANLYIKQFRHEEAESFLKEALEKIANFTGEEQCRMSVVISISLVLSTLYVRKRRLDEAEIILTQNIKDISRAPLGWTTEMTSGFTKFLIKIYKSQLKIKKKKFGKYHPGVVDYLNKLADIYNVLKRPNKAARLSKKALKIESKIPVSQQKSNNDQAMA